MIASAYLCGAAVCPNSWLMLNFCLPFACLICMLACCARLRYCRLWGATESAISKHRQLLLQMRVDSNFFGATCTACFVCSCQAAWQGKMQTAFCNYVLCYSIFCLALPFIACEVSQDILPQAFCPSLWPNCSWALTLFFGYTSKVSWAQCWSSSVPTKSISLSLCVCVCVRMKLQLVCQEAMLRLCHCVPLLPFECV